MEAQLHGNVPAAGSQADALPVWCCASREPSGTCWGRGRLQEVQGTVPAGSSTGQAKGGPSAPVAPGSAVTAAPGSAACSHLLPDGISQGRASRKWDGAHGMTLMGWFLWDDACGMTLMG